MAEENKASVLNEEYSITENCTDLTKPRLSKTLLSKENVEKIPNEKIQVEIIEQEKEEPSSSEKLENTKLERPFSSNVCSLKKLRSLSTLRLKNYKLKDTIDLLRCGSLERSQNLNIEKLPIDNQINFFKFSFESKPSDTDVTQFTSSFNRYPFTIELTDKRRIPSSAAAIATMTQSPVSSTRKKFTSTFEITVEKESNSQVEDLKQAQAVDKDVEKIPEDNTARASNVNDVNVIEQEKSDSVDKLNYLVLVAIDFGTTHSGYAYAYMKNPNEIHLMKRWCDGETRFSNFKIPTTILLNPSGEFHSFGYQAIEFYNDLEPNQSKEWHFFEKFKMSLHNSQVGFGKIIVKISELRNI